MIRSLAASSRIATVTQAVAAAGLVFALSSTGQAAPSGVATPPAPHRALRIVAFGSSSTEGVGASRPTMTYPAQLQAILARSMPKGDAVEVVNKGVGGEDVDDMMRRLDADVIGAKPDIVIWQTGSNDPMRHVPIERFEAETRDGVRAMQAAGLKVILMEPQWCPRLEAAGNASLFRDAIRKVAGELNVALIRRGDMMHRWVDEGRMTKAQMLAADGLHMSDVGYAELAREIAPDVLKARPAAAPVSLQASIQTAAKKTGGETRVAPKAE